MENVVLDDEGYPRNILELSPPLALSANLEDDAIDLKVAAAFAIGYFFAAVLQC